MFIAIAIPALVAIVNAVLTVIAADWIGSTFGIAVGVIALVVLLLLNTWLTLTLIRKLARRDVAATDRRLAAERAPLRG